MTGGVMGSSAWRHDRQHNGNGMQWNDGRHDGQQCTVVRQTDSMMGSSMYQCDKWHDGQQRTVA